MRKKKVCRTCSGSYIGQGCASVFCSTECRDKFAEDSPHKCQKCNGTIDIGWSLKTWEASVVCQGCASVKPVKAIAQPRVELMIDEYDGPVATRWQLLERDGFRCVYCGGTPIYNAVVLQADHIVPLSKGGSNKMSNVVTACSDCNYAKCADHLVPESLDMLLEAVFRKNLVFGIAPDAEYLPHIDRVRGKRMLSQQFSKARA